MRRLIAIFFIVLSSAAPAPAQAGGEALSGPVPGEVLRVIDGDTIEARLTVWIGTEITVLVRIAGIDAPEMKGKCPLEREKAMAARAELAAALSSGTVSLTDIRLEKYAGRVLARVSTNGGGDVAAHMLQGKFLRAYGGGRCGAWCAG